MRGVIMKYIELTQGKRAIVDDADFAELNKYRWHAFKNGKTWYARRHPENTSRGVKCIFMHNVLLLPKDGLFCDHRYHNGLDNRRKNLRECTKAENNWNAGIRIDNSSGYKGVSWHKGNKRWRARIHLDKKEIHIGTFESRVEAARAYDKKATELFGSFAFLNFPTNNPELIK
jgi:hypothetical protein